MDPIIEIDFGNRFFTIAKGCLLIAILGRLDMKITIPRLQGLNSISCMFSVESPARIAKSRSRPIYDKPLILDFFMKSISEIAKYL